MQGNPAVFVDSSLLKASKTGASGQSPWMYFSSDLKGNFITNELLTALKTIKALFDTEVGIPNTNTSKKERMLTDEVNSNNVETAAKASLCWTACSAVVSGSTNFSRLTDRSCGLTGDSRPIPACRR